MKNGLLDQIKSAGYWRITLRPIRPADPRLSLARGFEIVERAKVSLRGWDFPHIARRNDEHTGTDYFGDYVESWCEFMGQLEFWRIYKSGQFLSYKALIEDWENWPGSPGRPYLATTNTIYTVTEFVEFGHRLLSYEPYKGGVTLQLGLNNTTDRKLWAGPNRIPFLDERRTRADQIALEVRLDDSTRAGGTQAVAADVLVDIFGSFGWNPGQQRVASDVEKFLLRAN